MPGEKLYSNRYKHAVNLAACLFDGITRKRGNIPYVTHLISVSHITEQVTANEDVWIAALLHDVLEDIPSTRYSAADMEADYGPVVRQLVETVSHDEEKYGKQLSRQKYIEQLRTGPVEACWISGADLLDNSQDMIDWFESEPSTFVEVFGGSGAVVRLDFHHQRLQVLRGRLGDDDRLVQELIPVVDRVAQIHLDHLLPQK